MVNLSDLIIQHPEVNSFNELVVAVRELPPVDEIFLNFDVKPDYRDTPRNWQWLLEAAYCSGPT